jgi:hypothetical protein
MFRMIRLREPAEQAKARKVGGGAHGTDVDINQLR